VEIFENAAVMAAAILSCSVRGGTGTSISFSVRDFSSFWFVEPSPFFSSLL
jgi:hypothetical protein